MMMMICEDEEYMYTEGLASEQFGMSKKRKSMNKKRFNDEQIKSLETIFESESKLEPRKKLQVARELGLQPRQVAIWFQNKRARYKSKQLEQDYGVLRANYDNMASQFEELKKEKQALQAQLQKLNDQMKKSREENQLDGGDETSEEFKSTSTIVAEEKNDRIISMPLDDDGTVNGKNSELNEKLETSLCVERYEHNIGIISDDDSSLKVEYFGLEEEPELLNLVGPADSTLTSPENWGSLESEGLMTQSGSSCQWWDVWS